MRNTIKNGQNNAIQYGKIIIRRTNIFRDNAQGTPEAQNKITFMDRSLIVKPYEVHHKAKAYWQICIPDLSSTVSLEQVENVGRWKSCRILLNCSFRFCGAHFSARGLFVFRLALSFSGSFAHTINTHICVETKGFKIPFVREKIMISISLRWVYAPEGRAF